MSDTTDNQNDETSHGEPQGPLGGERLGEARREQQISVLEIAKELHLDEPKVRALERNDFDTIGAPVFAKGHLKKYAQLVGVDEGDVLKDYYELTRAANLPPVVSTRPRPHREMSPGPWIAVVIVLIVVATAYWWLTSRPVATTEPESSPEEGLPPQEESVSPAGIDDAGIDDTVALAVDDSTGSADGTAPDLSDTVVAISATDDAGREPVQTAAGEGELRLSVTYSGDCWTEITDASGARLFFDLGKEGRTVELSGDPPFNVLFGNADNVSLEVNGSAYAIGPSERRGRTARLTLSGT